MGAPLEGVKRLFLSLVSLAHLACASNPAAPSQTPTAEPSATAHSEPAAEQGDPESAKQPVLPTLKVPEPPDWCAEYAQRQTTACATGPALELLADALSSTDAKERDAKLACLEADQGLPPGFVRALRADLGPEVCADALVAPFFESGVKLSKDLEQTLLGLLIQGKLARLGSNPPSLPEPFNKAEFNTFFENELTPWVLGQAAAIGDLSLQGSRLHGYGKAVAALAAGAADLRFVDLARGVPLPEEIKQDAELRDAYYAALDEALEPRKRRGRDAVLVALRQFAELGVLRDERLIRARALLVKLYGGARVDALDRLLLPTLPAPALTTTEQKLVAHLPTYYTSLLLPELDPTEPALLGALTSRGLPQAQQKKLDSSKLEPAVAKRYARALLDSGILYFRAADLKKAGQVALQAPQDDEARLIAALSKALEASPADAAELMLRGMPETGLGSVAELDALAKSRAQTNGLASFDAAYLLELTPRQDDPSYWEDIARRYDQASQKLKDPSDQARAAEYATEARSIAKALVRAPKPKGQSIP